MGREERLRVDEHAMADAAAHPGFVHVPSAGTEGVRSYREPEQPHPAQLTFLTPQGEARYHDHVRGLLIAGRLDEAIAMLERDLAPFEGRIAQKAKRLRLEDILIEGWDDLDEIIAEFEGPAITAITAGLGNEPDLVFDTSKEHEPTLMFALYSDDMFDFSALDDDELLDQCMTDCPGWVGHEEDVEFYVNIEGLAELNTALIQCKHIHFLRDGRDGVEGRAPGGYVEYQLGCWWRAALFLKAIAREVERHGLPRGVRLITGLVGMNADLATLMGQRRAPSVLATKGAAGRTGGPAEVATLTMKEWVPKHDPLADMESGASLRQRISASSEEGAQAAPPAPEVAAVETLPVPEAALFDPAPPPSAPETKPDVRPRRSFGGFLSRLFGRSSKD